MELLEARAKRLGRQRPARAPDWVPQSARRDDNVVYLEDARHMPGFGYRKE